jgi:hypothetical protein
MNLRRAADLVFLHPNMAMPVVLDSSSALQFCRLVIHVSGLKLVRSSYASPKKVNLENDYFQTQ